MLQILDEGRITDAQGRTVNFENTVIIMTSNAGSTDQNTMGFAKSSNDITQEVTMKALERFLRPEFLGRDKGIDFVYDDSVPVFLAKKAYGSKKNARGLRDAVRREIEEKVANSIVFNQDIDIKTISVSAKNEIQIKIKNGIGYNFCRR